MGILLAFAPFIVFVILERFVGYTTGLLAILSLRVGFSPLIRPNPLEGSGAAPVMKSAIECISLNYAVYTRPVYAPAKRQNTARLGANYEMLVLDGAFHAA